jgi:hypothetical protein
MDDYIQIEIELAAKHGATAKGTKKSIGDFLLDDNIKRPVNVKSNNVAKNNYSPNIISAKRLIEWLKIDGNELYFLFVNYTKDENGIKIVSDSGLIPVHHLSWDCLSIEAQGWGVIQMCKPLKVNENQDLKGFLKEMKVAYEKFMNKESKKMEKIMEMIKDF